MDSHEKITVLLVEPSQRSCVRQILPTLEAMQEMVAGDIERTFPFPYDPDLALVSNEDAIALDLPENRSLTGAYDDRRYVQGAFFLANVSEDGMFCSLSNEQIKRYTSRYDSTIIYDLRRSRKAKVRKPAPEQAADIEMNPVGVFSDLEAIRPNIRFTDASDHTLFHIPDGDNLLVSRSSGEEDLLPCHYIDERRAWIGDEIWQISQFARLMEENGDTYRPEYPEAGDVCDTYEVYQLKKTRDTGYGVMSYAEAGEQVRPKYYRRVYTGVLAPQVTLEDLFRKHNRFQRPFTAKMRDMSISDIIVCNRGGQRQAFYVDRNGFTECQEFLKPPRRSRSTAAKKRTTLTR